MRAGYFSPVFIFCQYKWLPAISLPGRHWTVKLFNAESVIKWALVQSLGDGRNMRFTGGRVKELDSPNWRSF
jgi:hypothetical protein